MMREPEDKRSVIDQLEAVRAAVRTEELPPERRAELEYALSELERDLLVAMPTDSRPFVSLLRDWEAKLEAEHPVLAGVVSDALQKLGAMGI